jgi:hypothetical protein
MGSDALFTRRRSQINAIVTCADGLASCRVKPEPASAFTQSAYSQTATASLLKTRPAEKWGKESTKTPERGEVAG